MRNSLAFTDTHYNGRYRVCPTRPELQAEERHLAPGADHKEAPKTYIEIEADFIWLNGSRRLQ